MNFTHRRKITTAAVVLSATVAVGTALTAVTALTAGVIAAPAAGASVHSATVPPWEPDPNSVGGLIFYNASGQVITGGSTTASPLAAYVEGTKTIRSGDTVATLYGYLPVDGQTPGEWSGEQLSGSTTFPNTAAPAPLKTATLPVVTGASTDESLATLEEDYPNNDSSPTDGYANMYVLRLKTSAKGMAGNTTYDSADIEVDNTNSTWTVVYSQGLQATTTTSLTLSPASAAYHGATVKLTAKLTPSAAAGSVQFLDGSKVLKTVAASAGEATYSTDSLADGVHKLSAAFVPTNTADFAASASSVHDIKISAHPTTTTLEASKSSIIKGQKLTLTAKESPAVAGSITFYDRTKKLATVKVGKGTAVYSSTKLALGSHVFKAVFAPSVPASDSASTSKLAIVTVKK